MEIIETIVSCTFAELNAEQKTAAVEYMRDSFINDSDTFWAEYSIEDMQERIADFGITDSNIEWSGFGVQGSGASINSDCIDIETFLRKSRQWSKFRCVHKLIQDKELTFKVLRNSHHYVHEYTVSADYNIEYYVDCTSKHDDAANEISSLLTEQIRDWSKEVYNSIEKEYEYQCSDECLIDQIAANEYCFKVNDYGDVLGLV